MDEHVTVTLKGTMAKYILDEAERLRTTADAIVIASMKKGIAVSPYLTRRDVAEVEEENYLKRFRRTSRFTRSEVADLCGLGMEDYIKMEAGLEEIPEYVIKLISRYKTDQLKKGVNLYGRKKETK